MKTSQIFIIAAIVISSTFFGILSMFGLPQSVMEWAISDVVLGVILYVAYLILAMIGGSSKNKMKFSSKRITA